MTTVLADADIYGTKYELRKLGQEYVVTIPFEGISKVEATIQVGAVSDDAALDAFKKWAVHRFREFPPKP